MEIEIYSHNNGEKLIDSNIKDTILATIENTNYRITRGCGNELRKLLLTKLRFFGWSDDFVLDANSQISLTSSMDEFVLCFQTGNMSRFYADLLKMEYVYNNQKAKAAIYILPSKEAAKELGSNYAHFDRVTSEVQLFKKIITIPILVLGIS